MGDVPRERGACRRSPCSQQCGMVTKGHPDAARRDNPEVNPVALRLNLGGRLIR